MENLSDDNSAVFVVDGDCAVILDCACDNSFRYVVLYLLLDNPTKRSCAKLYVVALVGNIRHCVLSDIERDVTFFKRFFELLNKNFRDLSNLLFGEGVELANYVDTVEEFGTEMTS